MLSIGHFKDFKQFYILKVYFIEINTLQHSFILCLENWN